MKLKLHQGKNTGPAKIYSRLSSSRSSASTLSYSRMAVTSPLTFKAPFVNEMPSSSKSSPASSKYAYLHVPDQNKNINECYQLLRRKYKKYQIHRRHLHFGFKSPKKCNGWKKIIRKQRKKCRSKKGFWLHMRLNFHKILTRIAYPFMLKINYT